MKMSQIESRPSPPVYRCSLAYVFIEGKQIARDNAHLVLKTETGSSPALATRQANTSLPSRHRLLVYIGNSTEPKVSILLVTSQETPPKAASLPMIRYSHRRQYLLICTKSGTTSSPDYDLRFNTHSSLEEAISLLRRIGIRPMPDEMQVAPPKLPLSTGLHRHISTSSPGMVLSADDIRAGRVMSPFQRRLDGRTQPFALKRVQNLQRTSPAMSNLDTSQEGNMASMAQCSQSTIVPVEQRPATYFLPNSVPKRRPESSVSRGSAVNLSQTSGQASFQGSTQPSRTLPTLEEQSDELDFPIPNLDAGLGHTGLTLDSRPLKRRKGNRSQRKVQAGLSSLTKLSPNLKQDPATTGRNGHGRAQIPAQKTALEAQSLPSPQRRGLDQRGDGQMEVETGTSQDRMRSIYDSYVWEELRERLFSDVDRVSDDDLTMRLLVDRYERDMIEQMRNVSRS